MRMSQDEKAKSHGRIVASAAKLFRERGLEGASLTDVMMDARMTHGGFYKHFESKDVLIERALERAFDEFVEGFAMSQTDDAVAASRALYLSREHMTHPGRGCPVATLGAEIARGSSRLKAAFGAGVRRVVSAIAGSRKGSQAVRHTAALREFSMLVGAIVIARASDPEFADEVLAACGGKERNVD